MTKPNRRQWMLGAAASLAAAPPPSNGRPPNVLFCITDDQSWPHAGAYGASWIQTPAFDRIARQGVLFQNAFVSTPSCAPSRAAALTGQDFYRLGPASMNHTEWQPGLQGFPDLLAAAKGHRTGFTGKGWAPGNWRNGGRMVPPTGQEFNKIRLKPPAPGIADIDYAANFEQFLAARGKEPFCFWVGFSEPHRVFDEGYGIRAGKDPAKVQVPGFLPDTAEVRSDLADYAAEIEWADRQLGRMLDRLEKGGELANTIVIFTADNGMAFPRAKGNLYEFGVHVPLAIHWPDRVRGGQVLEDLVSLTDLAPTILEAAGVARPSSTTGRSLLPRLTGQARTPARTEVVCGIERHFPGSRPNGAGYPVRAIRNADYLYIENLTPERNPAGDRPGPVWPADDPTGGFGDTDGSPTKTLICGSDEQSHYLALAFGRRPTVELYDVRNDPANLTNLAGNPAHRKAEAQLKSHLNAYRKATADPRALGRGSELDEVMRRFPTVPGEVSRQQEGR